MRRQLARGLGDIDLVECSTLVVRPIVSCLERASRCPVSRSIAITMSQSEASYA